MGLVAWWDRRWAVPGKLPPGAGQLLTIVSSDQRVVLYAWMCWSCSAARMAAAGCINSSMAGLASHSARPLSRLPALMQLSTLHCAGHPDSALCLCHQGSAGQHRRHHGGLLKAGCAAALAQLCSGAPVICAVIALMNSCINAWQCTDCSDTKHALHVGDLRSTAAAVPAAACRASSIQRPFSARPPVCRLRICVRAPPASRWLTRSSPRRELDETADP